MSFDSLGLAPALTRALAEKGYVAPSPIQAACIPVALAGHDLMAAAQTGTGKTAGFVLPMLERLFPHGERGQPGRASRPRALVLTPTRELAMQVSEATHKYGRKLDAQVLPVFGGIAGGAGFVLARR